MPKMRIKMIKPSRLSSFSEKEVLSNQELLTEILLRLPVKSLGRCKCVSKKWSSLITSPEFTRLRVPCFNPARALFLHCSSLLTNPFHQFVSLSLENPIQAPFQKLSFIHDPSGIRILQSCNGLLLCCSFRAHEPNRNYYIYNPTTQQFITLPKPGGKRQISKVILGMKLAFDPWKSPHYKVVCTRRSEKAPEHYQIEIYSSETMKWRVSGPPFPARYDIGFEYTGVYWNGAIYWECGDNSLRFNVEHEKLEKFPTPCIGRSWDDEESRVAYYGESYGYLHLVQVHSRQKLSFYNIYEMKNDGTEWFLKYQVNVEDVVAAFPHMIRHYLEPTDWHYLAMAVLCVVRGEKEEDDFMVLHIPRMVIRYNLRDYTFYKLCEFGNSTNDDDQFEEEDEVPVTLVSLEFGWFSAFQYIESLFCL
ncbi:F-box protein At5g07610-like [Nicotiana tabacum]|uniref:F-box protein At5g07610-like n=1 Tax=Nicotiana tabacum TaxID=4097 RepID=A0A1S4CAS6_TOBAC|nr:F-box protein At5g07610-like [Nicotiana tomentosiformis]XP_016498059.1 PREDICTED: F-box protein At5g07610-like [Nicotiana tabacum]